MTMQRIQQIILLSEEEIKDKYEEDPQGLIGDAIEQGKSIDEVLELEVLLDKALANPGDPKYVTEYEKRVLYLPHGAKSIDKTSPNILELRRKAVEYARKIPDTKILYLEFLKIVADCMPDSDLIEDKSAFMGRALEDCLAEGNGICEQYADALQTVYQSAGLPSVRRTGRYITPEEIEFIGDMPIPDSGSFGNLLLEVAKRRGKGIARTLTEWLLNRIGSRHSWVEIEIDGQTYVADPSKKEVFGGPKLYLLTPELKKNYSNLLT